MLPKKKGLLGRIPKKVGYIEYGLGMGMIPNTHPKTHFFLGSYVWLPLILIEVILSYSADFQLTYKWDKNRVVFSCMEKY